MQTDIHELKLGPRGRALEIARRAKRTATPNAGDALDEAFADYTPPPRRTDTQHDLSGTQTWDACATAQEISAQLEQIEQQRKRLTQLLDEIGVAE